MSRLATQLRRWSGSTVWRLGMAVCALGLMAGLAALLGTQPAAGQEDQLNKVHVQPLAPSTAAGTGEPAGAGAPPLTGAEVLRARPGELIGMNVNQVLVPVTITDPLNRLVTGLEQGDFKVYENNVEQKISSFATEDAPVSIGIIFNLSASMTSKLPQARAAILEFIKTANPEDEFLFFVIGFNKHAKLLVDFTGSVNAAERQPAEVHTGNATALLDAIYLGVDRMKQAKHERKALLIVSDGGDSASRFSEGEVRAEVQESDVEMYSIGILDPHAGRPEKRAGPVLLNDLCEETGGRMFRVDNVDEMGDAAEHISMELRDQYVLGYLPKDLTRDGKWRKVKVKVNPPAGLPPLTVYARTGYYAPQQ